jgi:hypothetical protein
MQLGIKESTDTNRIYLNLRIGKIAQTSKDEKPGFKPVFTTNKSGARFDFFAKSYDELTGYVKAIDWHKSEFSDGGTSQGWNIAIDTGAGEYVLYLADKDRPFHRVMSVLGRVDFAQPVKFIGFSGKGGKVLLLYQSEGEGAKPVQPKWQEKWLSKLLRQKVKEKIELTDKERESLAYDDAGKILGVMKYDEIEETFTDGFPYIVQGEDDKWDFSIWTKYLMDKMRSEVIPAVNAATENRVELFIDSRNAENDSDDDYLPDSHYQPSEPDSDVPF